jgi:glycosyltransferase involved in cell wall biosynthesis
MDNSNCLISVVIPVYNSENYLGGLFDCLKNQTYQNFEVILVDDGSTDKSCEICDETAKNDSRFRVIHKENGGVSSARNAGINAAAGEYIAFIDSDDLCTPNHLESLYRCAVKFGAGVCFCRYVYMRTDTLPFLPLSEDDMVMNRSDYIVYYFKDNLKTILPAVCLISKDVLSEIRFSETLKYGEDTAFLFDVLGVFESIAVCGNYTYYYCQYGESTVRSPFSSFKRDIISAFLYAEKKISLYAPEQIPSLRLYSSQSTIRLLCEAIGDNADKKDIQIIRTHIKKSFSLVGYIKFFKPMPTDFIKIFLKRYFPTLSVFLLKIKRKFTKK